MARVSGLGGKGARLVDVRLVDPLTSWPVGQNEARLVDPLNG